MQEIRCSKCGKLLFKWEEIQEPDGMIDSIHKIEILCNHWNGEGRCKTMNTIKI
jgi:phage FluMu protein Com